MVEVYKILVLNSLNILFKEVTSRSISTIKYAANLPGDSFQKMKTIFELYENVNGAEKSIPFRVSILH